MNNPSILYWKWDDSHIQTEKYHDEITDICKRSPFSHIYITTHWCHNGICTDEMHHHIKQACEQIHKAGRKMIFEIDARAEKARFAQQYPQARAGFAYHQITTVENRSCSFRIRRDEKDMLFAGDRQSGEELLDVLAYRCDEKGRVIEESIQSIKSQSRLHRENDKTVTVSWEQTLPLKTQLLVLVWSQFDFPDLCSKEYADFSDLLLKKYADIPLDGLALDELCFMWHPDFDFTQNSYMVLDNCPIYSDGIARRYKERYGMDYITSVLYRYASDANDPRRIAAINRYFECIRDGIADAENAFFYAAKAQFGSNTFVGVHNTWFAIEEVQNSPEIWRTGVTWWSAKKEYGFTDELMLYPVRTALAHKASAPVFYNMWYSEATMDIDTFYTEIWKNVRFGGRTISLSYECVHETGIVQQLIRPGELEAIGEMESIIHDLDQKTHSPARCDVAVLTSLSAWCNRLCNVNGNGQWDTFRGVLKEVFTLTRDLFISGYNADMIGDVEVYAHNLFVNREGYVSYGNQVYTCLIIAYPQFAKAELLEFIAEVKKSKTRLIFVGSMDTNFEGCSIGDQFDKLKNGNPFYSYRPEITDLTALLERMKVEKNRVQNGCYMQDGSLVLTAPAPSKPTGNRFTSCFVRNGRKYTVQGTDVIFICWDEQNRPQCWSPFPVEIEVDENCHDMIGM